ncbi:Spy/CpxP family protein refolding chaperone [Sinorhizobium medicae]|uniref:LTXXQ motif family protein n=1 Tax=Sinorhizobium medicae TaxID=110321 RepID=A0A508WRF0_9HYPH|nr:Spy/CpxP family protein refolding chaperone [Sinorhizobium medicae]MDX0524809.1 hypothetical protein [Sinorhizobium medicae]VTZ59833.1 conserved exported hypothetical protein [Sinorhizobium medicae]
MTTLRTILLAGTVLMLSTPAFAEDAHHPETSVGQTSEQMAQPPDSGADPSSMMSCGMMSGDMMGDMMRMMAGGPGRMRPPGMGLMAEMMAPEHIEGRIAFLKTELKISPEQEASWNAFADILRANAGGMQEGMMQMPDAMGTPGGAAATPLQRLERRESNLNSRLEGVRKLKAAVAPLYQSLGTEQKQMADKLLLPPMMGMM